MFRKTVRIVFARRTLSTSNGLTHGGSVNKAGGKFAEQEKAREDKYFYELQKQQLLKLKAKTAKVEQNLQDEVDEIEGEIAQLKAQLNKKRQQLVELKEE